MTSTCKGHNPLGIEGISFERAIAEMKITSCRFFQNPQLVILSYATFLKVYL